MVPYILIGSRSVDIKRALKAIIAGLEVTPENIFEVAPEKKELTIAQIRELKKEIIYESSTPSLYILRQFDTARPPAQNACLKLLEEHPANIQFVLIAANEHAVIPTIRSRCKIIRLKKPDEKDKDLDVENTLDTLIKRGDMDAIMSEPFVSAKIESIDNIIAYFKERASRDPKATLILRETLKIRALVTGNNVSPQVAVDHLLIYIRQTYLSTT